MHFSTFWILGWHRIVGFILVHPQDQRKGVDERNRTKIRRRSSLEIRPQRINRDEPDVLRLCPEQVLLHDRPPVKKNGKIWVQISETIF